MTPMVRWAVGTTLMLSVLGLSLVGCQKPAAKTNPGDFQELSSKTLKEGSGHKIGEGDIVYIQYRGSFINGQVFDTNIERADRPPFAMTIGRLGSIKGLQEALKGKQKGGQYEFKIPSSLAYGKSGQAPNIPPDTGLIFYVEVLDVVPKDEPDVVTSKDITVGTGPAAATNDKFFYHFQAFYVDGKKIDDSRLRKPEPESFVIGKRQAIPGVDYGVIGMKAGGKRRLEIPPAMAWGEVGFFTVAVNQKLIIEIECIRIEKAGA